MSDLRFYEAGSWQFNRVAGALGVNAIGLPDADGRRTVGPGEWWEILGWDCTHDDPVAGGRRCNLAIFIGAGGLNMAAGTIGAGQSLPIDHTIWVPPTAIIGATSDTPMPPANSMETRWYYRRWLRRPPGFDSTA